jgi:hypothetical protein
MAGVGTRLRATRAMVALSAVLLMNNSVTSAETVTGIVTLIAEDHFTEGIHMMYGQTTLALPPDRCLSHSTVGVRHTIALPDQVHLAFHLGLLQQCIA